MQQAGCEGGGAGGAPFSDGMKTPSGKRQARLKGMAASGRRGGVTELWRRPMWGEDGGFGGAARSLAAADGAGRGGWEFFFVGWMALPSKRKGYGASGSRGRAMRDPSRLIPLLSNPTA